MIMKIFPALKPLTGFVITVRNQLMITYEHHNTDYLQHTSILLYILQ